ncbi:MAG: hypothetical protein ACRDFQ_01350 [Anaerolineales bacterium]
MPASALAKKLKLDVAKHAAIINAPEDYIDSLKPLSKELKLSTNLKGKYDWIQLLVKTEAELKALFPKVLKAMGPECRIWISFPKGSSGIQTNLSRDKGWGSLKGIDLKFITLVSVNDTWSAFNLQTYKPGEEKQKLPWK